MLFGAGFRRSKGRTKKCTRVADRAFAEIKVTWRQPGDFGRTATINADSNVTYVPALNYFGSDGFFYLASDSHGGYVFGVIHVTVQSVNDAPVANAGPDKTSSEASSVAFSGALSSDVDGDGDGDVLAYSWAFGDGQSGMGISPNHVYADNGVYTVTRTVADGLGGVAVDTMVVTVSNVAPVVTLSGATSGVRGQARSFTVSASDVSVPDQNGQFTYRVIWGDGRGEWYELRFVHISFGDGFLRPGGQ